ncbi:hypothetical protein BB8028_0001g03190 [Beauveria bassiana]|uniref:Uncharacterized protein n=1 Tax=Beauveria bassiana TaxID=176275 RepID=A0A2S7XWG6_BEABA|nr:hypothetical protein BB8028_0001g03190 [Beauveria bassiana]
MGRPQLVVIASGFLVRYQRRLISLKPEADLTYGFCRSRPLDETASAPRLPGSIGAARQLTRGAAARGQVRPSTGPWARIRRLLGCRL